MDPISEEIPTTIPQGEDLIKQAEDLQQRMEDNPDFKILLQIIQRIHRGTIFNTVYSVILTIVVLFMLFLAQNTVRNDRVLKELHDRCEQENKIKQLDLASWKYIIGQFPVSDASLIIIQQREVIDTLTIC